ncbi:hypothetical protein [Sphingomonas sp. 22R3R2A-7]|uniref:hypothetical protein n=1 Tax=Sphingomonas sp. 22R3R2A-7 TaxID=3050230 RepID=UPI002FE06FDE
MKLLGMLLLAGIILSVLQAALSVLVIIGLICLVIGVFVRPAETFGLLAFGVFANLMQSHPVGAIWLLSFAMFVTLIQRQRERTVVTHPTSPPASVPRLPGVAPSKSGTEGV